MLRSRVCDLFGIEHPVVLGGMASATAAPLVAAVSNAGGLEEPAGDVVRRIVSKAEAILSRLAAAAGEG